MEIKITKEDVILQISGKEKCKKCGDVFSPSKSLSKYAKDMKNSNIHVEKRTNTIIATAPKEVFEDYTKNKRWQARDDYFGGLPECCKVLNQYKWVELLENKIKER